MSNYAIVRPLQLKYRSVIYEPISFSVRPIISTPVSLYV